MSCNRTKSVARWHMNRLLQIAAVLRPAFRHNGTASLLIFLIALLVRGAFAVWLPDDILWLDGQRYVRIAESLLTGHGFGSLQMNKISVPTQPLLIAAFSSVFDGSYTLVRAGFAVLGAATCVLAYRLGTLVFDRGIGIVAGLMLALYPLHAYTSALFEVPQTFFMFTVTAAFLWLFRFPDTRRKSTLFVAGMFFGVSALSVPTVMPFFPAVLIWLMMIERRKSAWLPRMAAYSLGIVIAMSPWVIRNYIAYERFVLVNLAGGENFWKANSATYFEHGKRAAVLPCESGAAGERYCVDLARVQMEAADKGLSENDAIAYADRAGWQNGARYIRENPFRFLQLTGRKLIALFSPRPDAVSTASADDSGVQILVSLLTYVPILLLGLAGILRIRHQWRHLFPVYAYLSTLIGLYSVFVPTIRYRLPIDFFLILFAAYWLVDSVYRPRLTAAAMHSGTTEHPEVREG